MWYTFFFFFLNLAVFCIYYCGQSWAGVHIWSYSVISDISFSDLNKIWWNTWCYPIIMSLMFLRTFPLSMNEIWSFLVHHFYINIYAAFIKITKQFYWTNISGFNVQTNLPALIEKLNREADDLIICNNSLVFICHLATIFIGSIRSYKKKTQTH